VTMGPKSKAAKNTARGYRIITVSLFDAEADAADHLTTVLREAGWPKANRSLVIREALLGLADELQGKSSEEIFRYFLERYARRASHSSPSPNGVRSERDR
jgi:hypothetical protein